MHPKTEAIDKLLRIEIELAAFLVDIEKYNIEQNAVGLLRDTLHEMHATVRALWQGIERSRLSPGNPTFLALLIEEQLRRASQLNADIKKNLAAGRITTDQQGLSTYLRVLNQSMEQLDVLFDSRQAKPGT